MKPGFLLLTTLFLSGYCLNAQIIVKPGACKIIIDGILFNMALPTDTLKQIKEGKISVYNSLNKTYTSIREGQIYYAAKKTIPAAYVIKNGRISTELLNIMRNDLRNDDSLLFKELYYYNGSVKAKFSGISWKIKK